MAILTLNNVHAHYGNAEEPVLESINLTLSSGQLLVALGPSGSGKTTLLNLIAGFIQPSKGRITLDGQPVSGPGADRSMVFQDHALLPWQDVITNVSFGLQLAGVPKSEQKEIAYGLLERVGLAGMEKRGVWQLSGGQRQRVGLARALAARPKVLLLDEPFGALDAFTREQMQELLLQVWQQEGTPTFLITHDIEEAVFLATDLLLLAPNPGRVVEKRELSFGREQLGGTATRVVKSDPKFIKAREDVLQRVFSTLNQNDETRSYA